jgi:hypothetical protein
MMMVMMITMKAVLVIARLEIMAAQWPDMMTSQVN